MSFWKYIFDSEWSQRSDIEQLKSVNLRRNHRSLRVAKNSNRKIKQLREQVQNLEDTVGQMALYLKSVTTLLEEKSLVSQQDLRDMMAKIDAADGHVDGQTTL